MLSNITSPSGKVSLQVEKFKSSYTGGCAHDRRLLADFKAGRVLSFCDENLIKFKEAVELCVDRFQVPCSKPSENAERQVKRLNS